MQPLYKHPPQRLGHIQFFLKRNTGTGLVYITADNGTHWFAITVHSYWARYDVHQVVSGSNKCGIKIANNGDSIFAFMSQLENLEMATTPIPTVTGGRTRGAEKLTYAISGNRTAATESIFFNIAPCWRSINSLRVVMDTDTKERYLNYQSQNYFQVYPNKTDSVAVEAFSLMSSGGPNEVSVNAVTIGGSSPYASAYVNGGAVGTYTTGGFTTPTWGTNFYIGSDNAGANQFNGIIKSVAIYSDTKNSTDVGTITNIMKTNNFSHFNYNIFSPFTASAVDQHNNVWFANTVGLYESTNGGVTATLKDAYTNSINMNNSPYIVKVTSNGYIYWSPFGDNSGNTGALRRSTDGGTTWTTVLTPTQTFETGFWSVAENLSNNYLYTGVYTQGTQGTYDDAEIFKSTDNGATWTSVFNGTANPIVPTYPLRHIHDVAVDQTTGYVYATTGDGLNRRYILRSTDGTNFSVLFSGENYSTQQWLKIGFGNGYRIFADDDQGYVFITLDDVTLTQTHPGQLPAGFTPDAPSLIQYGNIYILSQSNQFVNGFPTISRSDDGKYYMPIWTG